MPTLVDSSTHTGTHSRDMQALKVFSNKISFPFVLPFLSFPFLSQAIPPLFNRFSVEYSRMDELSFTLKFFSLIITSVADNTSIPNSPPLNFFLLSPQKTPPPQSSPVLESSCLGQVWCCWRWHTTPSSVLNYSYACLVVS